MERLPILQEYLTSKGVHSEIYESDISKIFKQLYVWCDKREFSVTENLITHKLELCDISSNWTYIVENVPLTKIPHLMCERLKLQSYRKR